MCRYAALRHIPPVSASLCFTPISAVQLSHCTYCHASCTNTVIGLSAVLQFPSCLVAVHSHSSDTLVVLTSAVVILSDRQ
jgi:hypothetical protein